MILGIKTKKDKRIEDLEHENEMLRRIAFGPRPDIKVENRNVQKLIAQTKASRDMPLEHQKKETLYEFAEALDGHVVWRFKHRAEAIGVVRYATAELTVVEPTEGDEC